MSLMGIGTNILGYANKKVNDRINLTLKKSNMSTLNCPEEVTLAENLIKIHPWFNMVKFAKTEESNAIAIRIARASTKRIKLRSVVIMVGMIGIYQLILMTKKI